MPESAVADLLVDRPRAGVLLLTLNRPQQRNALATPLLQLIAAALSDASDDADIRAVVITGSEKVFAAGADIDELSASGPDDPVETPRFHAWAAIRAFEKPLLAGIEGYCLGAGTELMLCADIVVAGASAQIGFPETNLGIIPGAGGTALLPRRIGRAHAMKMVLTGEPITAVAARDIGLIAETVEAGGALEAALDLAEKLAARSPSALRAAKASIGDAEIMPEMDHLIAERQCFIALLGSPDKVEGIAAFKEKRKPVWSGG